MRPRIDRTKFGSITIEGITYSHDVIIRPDGQVKKRKKKLSKSIYGTSHILSLDEAKYIYSKKAQTLIIGTGHFGRVRLSEEAADFFDRMGYEVKRLPTPEVVPLWNKLKGEAVGLFHVTC
jgi:hypothetical protein